MKKTYLVTTVVLALLALLVFAGCGAEAADDPNLGLYTAATAEMWGIEMPISDLFENGVSIELKAKGKCTMNFDGTSGNGKWTLEDGAFYAEAGGAILSGTLENGVILAENVMDMGVNITFAKEGFTPVSDAPAEVPAAAAPEAVVEASPAEEAAPAEDTVPAEETAQSEFTPLQMQWSGTWYGVLYIYEKTGDFAYISEDALDAHVIVDVADDGKGSLSVFLPGAEEPFAEVDFEATNRGLNATGGSVLGLEEFNTKSWSFRPVPDFPDRYTVTDEVLYDGSFMSFSLFMKKWGISWQDEIDTNFEIVPPSVSEYEAAIAAGELPPMGFAPPDYVAVQSAAPAESAAG